MEQPDLSGRELDAAVAEAIGLKREAIPVYQNSTLVMEFSPPGTPPYHRSLDACMSAYAVLRKHGWRLATIADIDERICVRLWHETKAPFEGIGGCGPTAPTAFARAMVEAGKRSTQ